MSPLECKRVRVCVPFLVFLCVGVCVFQCACVLDERFIRFIRVYVCVCSSCVTDGKRFSTRTIELFQERVLRPPVSPHRSRDTPVLVPQCIGVSEFNRVLVLVLVRTGA